MTGNILPKRWIQRTIDAKHPSWPAVAALQQQLGIKPLWCQLLVQRGITSYEEAYCFFRPSFEHIHDPFLMPDMHRVCNRIRQAIQDREPILVFGDYDVDGTTSVAILYDYLQRCGATLNFDIPDRLKEGYGLSKAAVDRAIQSHTRLLITLDCGMKDLSSIDYANQAGIDVIVCDHHLQGTSLPNAYGILNPLLNHHSGHAYPYRDLSACGITFKLIQALQAEMKININIEDYLDRVALSIAADIVPLTGENRTLLALGLKQINTNPSTGLQALIEVSGLSRQAQRSIGIRELGFILAPRVNAAGRMKDAHTAVQLFMEKDLQRARELAAELHQRNQQRMENDRSIAQEARDWIENHPEEKNRKTIVVYQPHWHKGVIGIVASRLVEWYFKPTVVLTAADDQQLAGSARSVPGYNLYQAIDACGHLLERYGGHDYAAGLVMEARQLKAFRETFEEVVSSTIQEEQLMPALYIDAIICPDDITESFIRMLKQFEPFGMDNEPPVFLMRNITAVTNIQPVKNEHLKFQIQRKAHTPLEAVGFQMADYFDLFRQQKPIDICFTIEENYWNGQASVQLKLLDMRISHQSAR